MQSRMACPASPKGGAGSRKLILDLQNDASVLASFRVFAQLANLPNG